MKASLRPVATPSPKRRSRPRVNDRPYPKTRPSGQHPRRQFLRLAVGAASLPALSRMAWAQTYPTRPVRLIVGTFPGSANDILARLIGPSLSERLGQPLVIDNRPGAGTNTATEAVVRAPADGYTLLLTSVANAISATLYNNLNFNFIRDIVPIASFSRSPFLMQVNLSVPAKTVPEFIAYAKANPNKVNMASARIGTGTHLSGELFKMMAGIDMVHIPYRGSPFSDLIGGQVQVYFGQLPSSIELIRANRLRALAVTTATRSEALPDIPTVAEFLPGYETSAWLGVGAPKTTPAEIVERLNRAINSVLADPRMKARLADLIMTPFVLSAAEFGKLIADETEKWGKVIRTANIKPE